MALSDPSDTLAFHLARSLTLPRDLNMATVGAVAARCKPFFGNADSAVPETEALRFYAMNHGMAAIRTAFAPLEPLGDCLPFVEEYYAKHNAAALRAFYYLLLICTREARHLLQAGSLKQAITDKFGAAGWLWTEATLGEGAAHQKLLNDPPSMTIGTFARMLQFQFYHGKWGSSFGGPAWGKVSDCLCRFIHGEITAELMLDTTWTLAHNNGPIFNKGYLYSMYGPTLVRILDVQAAGQILPMVLTDSEASSFVAADIKACVEWLDGRFPGLVAPYVDWFAVEVLGGKNEYPAEKTEQLKLHGPPASQDALIKAAAAKAAAEAVVIESALKAAAQAKADHAKNWFEVYPGFELKQIHRKQAA